MQFHLKLWGYNLNVRHLYRHCMWGGDSTYDLEAVRRQAQYRSSDRLSELCARLFPFVSLDHMQELIEKQVNPQPLHCHWLLIKRRKQVQESSLYLLVWKGLQGQRCSEGRGWDWANNSPLALFDLAAPGHRDGVFENKNALGMKIYTFRNNVQQQS